MSTGTLQSDPRVNWPRSVSRKRHLNCPLCNFCSCCPRSPSYNNPPPPLFGRWSHRHTCQQLSYINVCEGQVAYMLTCSRIRTTLSNHGLWPTVVDIINNLTVTVNPTITALIPLRSWQLQSSESRHNHLILLESEHTTGQRI